jgi:aminoglycoside/choline kinase family phosphotransferase
VTPAEQLDAALTAWDLRDAPRTRLSGDVSPRQYFRLRRCCGDTAVVMVTPEDRAAQAHDWLAIGAWLTHHGVPTPQVLARHEASVTYLIEDVGDRLLTEVPAAEADGLYRATLAHLARLERVARDEPQSTSPAHARSLESERIRWELRRFRKVVAGFVADLDADELELWKEGEDRVTAALLAAPRVWMHRDLHARNLLVQRGEAVWIDFQDAMRGPWLYDVASLLLDPYAALPRERILAMREAYLAFDSRADGVDTERLWRLVGVQRLVHCIACYVWVAEHVGNAAYLRYLPFALRERSRAAGSRARFALAGHDPPLEP